MTRAIAQFLEEPTGPHFTAAWRSVKKTGRTVDIVRLQSSLENGDGRVVLDELSSLPRWLRLSPRVHDLAGQAALLAGEVEDFRIERFLFGVCLTGMMAAGDGTAAAPYPVVLAADEAVILAVLGRESLSQALVSRNGRRLDVVCCRDGGEVCFDVTHLLQTPARPPKKLSRKTAKVARVR